MEQQKFQLFKVRQFTDAINDTLGFAKDYFAQYGYVILMLVVPLYVLGAFVYSSAISSIPVSTNFIRNLSRMGMTSGMGVSGILIISLGALVMHLVFITAFIAVERSPDGKIDQSDIFTGMRENAGRMIALYLQIFLIMIVVGGVGALMGFALVSVNAIPLIVLLVIALVIGMLYVAVPLSFLSIVYIREELSFRAALSRCFYLTRGCFWQTLLILFVAGLIGSFAGAVFQMPQIVLNFMKTFTSVRSGRLDFEVSTIDRFAMGLSQFGSIVTTTVTAIATCIQYYSLVEKKDGTTLLEQIENIGSERDTNDTYQ